MASPCPVTLDSRTSLYVQADWQRRQRNSSPTGSPTRRRRSARLPARA